MVLVPRGQTLRVFKAALTCSFSFFLGCLLTLSTFNQNECNIKLCTQKLQKVETSGRGWLGLWHQPEESNQKGQLLVVLILTTPSNLIQRDAIRQTWLKGKSDEVKYFFVIGSKTLSEEDEVTLKSEQKRFGDLLLLSDVEESYTALAKKVLAAYVWLNSNVKFSFVLKCDDDSFVRIPELVQELKQVSVRNRLYWGYFDGRAHVKGQGRWKEKEWVLCDHYLPYALGGGYVLSSDLIQFIAENSKYLKLYNSEDITVGTWLAPVNIHRVHDPRFDTEFMSRGCFNSYLITHKQTTGQMKEKFDSLQHTGKLCPQEFRVRNSYIYNWKLPPSLCCTRNDTSVP